MSRQSERESGRDVGPRVVRRHGALAELVGESSAIGSLRAAIRAVAATRSTVLLTGETGTGKGLVARLLHRLSGAHPFVHVDCAALPRTLVESELFGHERGAFTGAHERRIGRFESVGSGTLFLDEVSETDAGLQAKLLRALQDRRFERVGGNRSLPLRARVLAASNRDLHSEIGAGRFRADLYYRLQVVELHLPPLRERAGDLPLLFFAALGRLYANRPRPTVEPSLLDRLEAHPWPGNVRELFNLVERLSVVRPEGPWRSADVDALLRNRPRVAGGDDDGRASRARFEARERVVLSRVLERHRWNVSATARALGIGRGALRGRMARLGLGPGSSREP